MLAALCDTPAELIATRAENAALRRTATGETAGSAAGVVPLRPKRARIDPDR